MNTEQQKNRAIITITKGGYELGKVLKNMLLDADLYANKKYVDKHDFSIKDGVGNLSAEIFNKYSELIYIMATGIVIRSIAPYIRDKTLDPAVVVMDEKGRNVISLLSGHLGGANDLTLHIAKLINSNPVITTASDTNNKISIDMLANRYNLALESMDKAKKITANILDGQSYCIYDELELANHSEGIDICTGIDKATSYDNIIAFTNKEELLADNDYIILRPKSLVVGLGCRRGKPWTELYEALVKALKLIGKNIFDIKHLATVDLKADEQGLIDLSNKLGVELRIIDRSQIKPIEDRFDVSEFVKKTIGVGAVAEPVAVLASEHGKLILNKTKFDGITIAIVEE